MCVKESENKGKALQCLSMYMTIPQALSSLIFFFFSLVLIDFLIWHNVFQILALYVGLSMRRFGKREPSM